MSEIYHAIAVEFFITIAALNEVMLTIAISTRLMIEQP